MSAVTYENPIILDSTGQDIVTQLTRLANSQTYTAGDGINISNQNEISTKVASASQLGAVKVGDGLSIDGSTHELSVIVDNTLSTSSENPVQNKVLTNAISAISSMSFEVVQELPTTDIQTDVIYLVPKSTSQTNNTYDEYICLDNTTTPATWEKIGDTQIDLSNYVQKSSTTGLIKNDGTIDTTITGAVSANTTAISGIKDGTSIDSFGDVENALADKSNLINIASPFSESISYEVGDYCIYNGRLYVCTTAHTGAWSSMHFSPTATTSPIRQNTKNVKKLFQLNNENGVTNYLNHHVTSQETSGVTVTVAENKTITINGTTTSSLSLVLLTQAELQALIDHYNTELYLCGSPYGGFGSPYEMSFQYTTASGGTAYCEDIGNGDFIPTGITVGSNLTLSIASGTTCDNLVFSPMIADSQAQKSPYQPYAMSNRELTDAVKTIPTVSIATTGTASSTGVRSQKITIDNVSTDIDGSAYMEQQVTLSTSAATPITFTNAIIADGKMLTFASSLWDLVPDSITTAVGSCTITLPKWSSAETIGCRLYVR